MAAGFKTNPALGLLALGAGTAVTYGPPEIWRLSPRGVTWQVPFRSVTWRLAERGNTWSLGVR